MKIRVQKKENGCKFWLVEAMVPDKVEYADFAKGVVISDNGKISWAYLSSLTVIDPEYTGGNHGH